MVIGRSGCGKTTWLVQTAGNIMRRFDKACVWHDDVEGGIVETRRERLTGLFGNFQGNGAVVAAADGLRYDFGKHSVF